LESRVLEGESVWVGWKVWKEKVEKVIERECKLFYEVDPMRLGMNLYLKFPLVEKCLGDK